MRGVGLFRGPRRYIAGHGGAPSTAHPASRRPPDGSSSGCLVPCDLHPREELRSEMGERSWSGVVRHRGPRPTSPGRTRIEGLELSPIKAVELRGQPDPRRRVARAGHTQLRHPGADQALRPGAPERGRLRPLLGHSGAAPAAREHRRDPAARRDGLRSRRRDPRHGGLDRGHRGEPAGAGGARGRGPGGLAHLRLLHPGHPAGRCGAALRTAGRGRQLRPRSRGHRGRGRPPHPCPHPVQPQQSHRDGLLGGADAADAEGRRARGPHRHRGRGLQGLRVRRGTHPQRGDRGVGATSSLACMLIF